MELGSFPGGRSSREFLVWRTGGGRGENVVWTNVRPTMVELRSHAEGLGLSEKIPAVVELGSHAGESNKKDPGDGGAWLPG